MEESKKQHISVRTIKAMTEKLITKAASATNISAGNGLHWIEPSTNLEGVQALVEHSTILPQCIRAYKDNIAGFGIGIRYIEDGEESTEMKAEYTKLEAIIDQLNLEMDTKEVFEDIIEAREMYGVAYLEVMRNLAGEVNQIDFIKETHTIRKSIPAGDSANADYFYKGQRISRPKQYRQYKQEKNGKTVYFKEFGDVRPMDKDTGAYSKNLELSKQANEIIDFTIGTNEYGAVRWIGQTLNVDGSRAAENLNNNYFRNGRHTPLMIVVSGGSLSEESFTKLQGYMDGIRGENGQHAFMVLEVEDTDTGAAFEENKKPTIEIKDMASILQKDELFQDYLDNSRKKVQSAFRLPDLYVGYTADFNRATAQTAQEITEQQIFIPERKSLAWVINNQLLNAYELKHVEVFFKAPDITNPEDMAKILNITERAGGITPNIAKEITLTTLGKPSEPYDEEWGDVPLAVLKAQPQVAPQLDSAIQKAEGNKDTDLVAIMKEVKRMLQDKEG